MDRRRAKGLLAAVLLVSGGVASAQGAAVLTPRQSTLLEANCLQCHARPGVGAPVIGDADAWRERARQGEDRLLSNVVVGIRGMPPLGYCSACTEQDLRALIRAMADLPSR